MVELEGLIIKEFADRLKELRTERGLTQTKLAIAIGVNKSLIAKYELWTSRPRLNTICRLADYFDVSVDYLLGITN